MLAFVICNRYQIFGYHYANSSMTKTLSPKSVEAVLRQVTLRELRLLLAVAKAGSILKAADEIGLTQPAASRALADLEKTMGVRLFDRTNRGVEATPQGRILLTRSLSIFDEMRLAVAEINALADATTGEVRVGGTPALCGGLLAHIVAQEITRRPAVRYQVDEMETGRLVDAIRARALDLGLGREPPSQVAGDIAFEHVFDDRLFLVAGRLHPMAARRKLSPDEFADQQWLLPAPGSETHRQTTDAFHRHGVTLPSPAVTTMSFLMRCKLLQKGSHVTAMHGSALRYAQLPGICILPIDLATSIPVGIYRLQGRTLPPASEAFVEVIRNAARTMTALGTRELNAALRTVPSEP
jgi:DNA-binding transcriptional LysR family regulator